MNKIDNPRLLLAKLRKGDFAHAGDKEAIDIVLAKILSLLKNKQNIKALDVGSGLGGTAAYIKNKTNFDIIGIDIDETAIQHAKKNYADIEFIQCDMSDVKNKFQNREFDLIYLFNVFYALPDQENSLKLLAEITKPNGVLVIFDYTCDKEIDFNLKDLAERNMNPVNLQNLKIWLEHSNWDLLEIDDLTQDYIRWYENFLKLMQDNKKNLLTEFSEEAYSKIYSTFTNLLENLKNKKLNGSVVYAQLMHLKTLCK